MTRAERRRAIQEHAARFIEADYLGEATTREIFESLEIEPAASFAEVASALRGARRETELDVWPGLRRRRYHGRVETTWWSVPF